MACLEEDEIYDVTNEWKTKYTINTKEETIISREMIISNIPWVLQFQSNEIWIQQTLPILEAICAINLRVEVELEDSYNKKYDLKFDSGHAIRDIVGLEPKITAIHFSVTETKGLFFVPFFNYMPAFTNRSHVILQLGNQKVRAGKQLLSIHSSFFFDVLKVVSDQGLAELHDVNVKAFLQVLRIIHPQCKTRSQSYSDLRNVLRLGDRFKMQAVIDYCEREMLKEQPDPKNFLKDFAEASKFGMNEKINQILQCAKKNKIKISSLKSSDLFTCLSNDHKLLIYETLTVN